MSYGVGVILPITRGLGIRARELDEERCVTRMPRTRRARNHVGTAYLGALTIHAEVTMAMWAMGVCRPPRYRTLVKRLESDFKAQAKHAVLATCHPEGEAREAILAALEIPPGEKAEAWLTVRSTCEETGRLVVESRFLISIKHMS
jgi:acyl-coenzyme A thioesterase PaaI-like protein